MSVSSVFCKVIHFTLSATTKKVAIKFAIIIHIIKRMTRYRHKNYSNRLPISHQRRNATASPTGILAAVATVNDANFPCGRVCNRSAVGYVVASVVPT